MEEGRKREEGERDQRYPGMAQPGAQCNVVCPWSTVNWVGWGGNRKDFFKFGMCRAHELNPLNSPNQLCHTEAVCVLVCIYICVCVREAECAYLPDRCLGSHKEFNSLRSDLSSYCIANGWLLIIQPRVQIRMFLIVDWFLVRIHHATEHINTGCEVTTYAHKESVQGPIFKNK